MTHPHHQSLRLQNFTCFKDCEMTFSPGINVFVGENGTGKTNVMKALYVKHRTLVISQPGLTKAILKLYQIEDYRELVGQATLHESETLVSGWYLDAAWQFSIREEDLNGSGDGDGSGYGGGSGSGSGNGDGSGSSERTSFYSFHYEGDRPNLPFLRPPVFIPAIELMGHTRGLLAASKLIDLDFDLTCFDFVRYLGLPNKGITKVGNDFGFLAELLGGTLEYDVETTRFYLMTPDGRINFPMVAEGLRRIATLLRLAQNGWLEPGTTLFWDEPEVNLNPKLMDELIKALLILARSGVQIFLATHSYVILKELDLQATPEDKVLYHAFAKTENGTIVTSTKEFSQVEPNPILEQYDSLYDRELDKAIARSRSLELV